MEKLTMCRVCLGEDLRLHSIVATPLQEMYESLASMPLETIDSRPVLACYICCARLKNCYELRKICLQSEELFTQMLSSNESQQVPLREINNRKRLTVYNAVHVSMGHELEISADNVPVEALKFEVKLEPIADEDIDENALEETSVFDNVQSADSKDFVITVKEEQTGDMTSDLTSQESNEASPRNPKDFTTNNLKDHERVQNIFKEFIKIEVTDKIAAERKNEVTFTLANDNKVRPTSVPRSERVQYTCGTCQQCYSSKCELERHVRVCSAVRKKDLSRENSTSTHTAQKPHQCNICKRQFSAKSYLSNHMRTHTSKKSYCCDICKKLFSQRGLLNTHMRTHSGEKLFHCDICKKQFASKQYLISHIGTHTSEKHNQCYICKKQFTSEGNKRIHMRTHTGEKPYHCDLCNKRFSVPSHLISHMRTHTGEKPYCCSLCKKQFSQTSNIISHMRTHTGEQPYRCDLCNKRFALRGNLNRHMRTHTGEKPHQCNICKKSFSHLCYLKKHMATHTDKTLV